MDNFLGRNDAQVRCRGLLHIVKEGDTLYKIAKQHGVPLSRIMYANPYVNVYNLQAGDEICVPVMTPRQPEENMRDREMPGEMGMPPEPVPGAVQGRADREMPGEMGMPMPGAYNGAVQHWEEEGRMENRSEMMREIQENKNSGMQEFKEEQTGGMQESEGDSYSERDFYSDEDAYAERDAYPQGDPRSEMDSHREADMSKTVQNASVLPWKDTKVSPEMVHAYLSKRPGQGGCV